MKKMLTLLFASLSFGTFAQCPVGTTPYYLQTTDPNTAANWNSSADGSGAALVDFTSDNICYNFKYESGFIVISTTYIDAVQTGDWNITGSNCAINLEGTSSLQNGDFRLSWTLGTELILSGSAELLLKKELGNELPAFNAITDCSGLLQITSTDGSEVNLDFPNSNGSFGSLVLIATGGSDFNLDFGGANYGFSSVSVVGGPGSTFDFDFHSASVSMDQIFWNVAGSNGDVDITLKGDVTLGVVEIGGSTVIGLDSVSHVKVEGSWLSHNTLEDVFYSDNTNCSVEWAYSGDEFDFFLSEVQNIIGENNVQYLISEDVIMAPGDGVIAFADDANVVFSPSKSIVIDGTWSGNGFRFLGDFDFRGTDRLELDVPVNMTTGTLTIPEGAEISTGINNGGGTFANLNLHGQLRLKNVFNDYFIQGGDSIHIYENGLLYVDESTVYVPATSHIVVHTGGSLVQDEWSSSEILISGTYDPAPITVEYDFGYSNMNNYSYLSSPIIGSSPIFSNSGIYKYNDRASGMGGWVSTWEAFEAGRGYAVLDPQGSVSWTGIPHNNYFTDPFAPEIGEPLAGSGESWTLVGNPYPSPIHAETFLDYAWNSSNLMGAVYIWDQEASGASWGQFSTSDYTVINGTGSTWLGGEYADTTDASNYWIAPMQGFFVEGDPTAYADNVYFGNEMRLPELASHYSFDLKNNSTKRKMWLALRKESMQTTALIGFLDSATVGWDKKYDASPNLSDMGLTSKVGDKDAVIQGLPPFTGEETIELNAFLNGDGEYEVDLAHTVEMDGQEMWLTDLKTGVVHPLHERPYVFSEMEGEEQRAFTLVFEEPGVVAVNDQLNGGDATFLVARNGSWMVQMDGNVQVHTLDGRSVWDAPGKAGLVLDLNSGVYIVSLDSEELGRLVQKVIVN